MTFHAFGGTLNLALSIYLFGLPLTDLLSIFSTKRYLSSYRYAQTSSVSIPLPCSQDSFFIQLAELGSSPQSATKKSRVWWSLREKWKLCP